MNHPSPAHPLAPPPVGPGSVSGVPDLPPGFAETFTSRYVDTGRAVDTTPYPDPGAAPAPHPRPLHLHAVTGGEGPPLLLLAGWPQTWYAWRLLMPALARHHQVVAVDPRGVGLSDKPVDGYDTGTLAADMVALMAALGHERFAMVGHDIGMWTGYALAADHPDRLDRLVVAEAAIPGLSPSPPLFGNRELNDRLWHFGFNRLAELNEVLVRGREHAFFSHQFATKAATPTALPPHAVQVYVDALAAGPEALRSSFAFYRALDTTTEQNTRRKEHRLTLPVLTIAGADCSGELVGDTMRRAADHVESLILPNCGHYPSEEAPEATLTALTTFLTPYRERSAQP
ncbi:alpha/beta fold hydrolase [Streptomyces liangshanensis]|uniref:alpha/beta fold hydrolase n=1 Tax=Streptomyces liangshanensis TaxID=2717324 RepID=UPI0036DF6855